jgi:hypothetical protein
MAALMRGAGEVRSITIEATADYLGHTGIRSKPADSAFITWAGPWAEARAGGADALAQLDDDDAQ